MDVYPGKNIPKLDWGYFSSKFDVDFRFEVLHPVSSGDFQIFAGLFLVVFPSKSAEIRSAQYIEIPTRYRLKHLGFEFYTEFRSEMAWFQLWYIFALVKH